MEHTKPECAKRLLPVRDTLEVLAGKWKILILIALLHGDVRRFKELQKQVDGITARMLSKELKELEMHELVTRTVYDSTPVTVEYEATPYARTLLPVLDEMYKWGALHRKRIIKTV
jgi:DNA-binding HxlR family transcriptional regulator